MQVDTVNIAAMARFIVHHTGACGPTGGPRAKIECIKHLRSFAPVDLREAKEIIEATIEAMSDSCDPLVIAINRIMHSAASNNS